ncbi:type II toxin-antitoxin system Phd/YefM family antitoxin [Pseudomonas sp. S75]|uniref:type II toxin-antitoxin system Phd/YefM family antitoxin n=1 Tax=unclassified Pseudomonas TaxID=196821 RepID=UPI0019061047|nr:MULTISPECIES: type II toxin-antitoxin system Phd/YefM family antitoxin [unclassified Pseudomonas]MBJ9974503.1 type II toxin-antitoxin system Phd/YefM family antitoxin [Pseudomonas sp. S30]MBK0153282.1 type II toxin-antitoxin system Phd/YefM family antitoxin [Pseudomonas sp. S75]
MHVITFSQARADLKQTIDDVCRDHEPTVIIRERGQPLVMLSLQDYNGMHETLYLLSSSANRSRLRKAPVVRAELSGHDSHPGEATATTPSTPPSCAPPTPPAPWPLR